MGKSLILICIVFLSLLGCAQEEGKDQLGVTRADNPSELQKELTQAPEEMLSSFSVSGYTKGGKKQWDLEGKGADILDQEIKLTDVTGKVYGKDMCMTILADEGSLNRLDNNVHLEKNIFANTDDGATMTTDCLNWDAQNQRLSSGDVVWIKRGMMQATGTGVVAHPEFNSVELKKDITVTLSLQPSLQKAGAQENSALSAEDFPEQQPPTLADDSGLTAQMDDASQTVSAQGEPNLTVITCDGPLKVIYQDKLAVFKDNVKVKDSRGEIFADKMDVYFTTQDEAARQIEGIEGMGIQKIVAIGNTEIHHGDNITYSQRAVYDTNTGKLTLTGKPKLIIYSTGDLLKAD